MPIGARISATLALICSVVVSGSGFAEPSDHEGPSNQREYWEWRNQNNARFRQDQRFHDNQRVYRDNQRVYRNDHDADDRRGRDYARTRNGDRDRHRDDKDRHQVRNRNHDKDGDHDRDRDRR